MRKNQLEIYLTQLLSLPKIPARVLEFIEFHKSTNTSHRLTLIEDMLNKMKVTIISTEIIIDSSQRPKMHFILELKTVDSTFTVRKVYKDFKLLHEYLQNTFLNTDEQLYL